MPFSRSAVTDALRAIWDHHKLEIMSNVELVERAVSALLLTGTAGDDHQAAVPAAHKLTGSAGMFGFEAASRAAHRIELLLESGREQDAATVRQLVDLVTALREELETDRSEAGSASRPPPRPGSEGEAGTSSLRLSRDQ
jgi:HPt (histidine-containing phosphotransfer) domain-containing protein